ncbi:hypothetical protein SPD48_15310 [Pseudogracilibacillus sp. SE30717A]
MAELIGSISTRDLGSINYPFFEFLIEQTGQKIRVIRGKNT